MEKNKGLVEFCDEYGIELSVLYKYLDYLKMGDNISAGVYYDIIKYNCSNHNVNEMEEDLKKIIKSIAKDKYEA